MISEPKNAPFKLLPLSRRHRRFIASLFIITLASLTLIQRLGCNTFPLSSDHQRFDKKTFTVVKVVDGDTIDIDVPDGQKSFTRIRLWGVDTPETKHPRKDVMFFGPESSAFTEKQTLGQKVKVVLEPFENTRGKYGRLLAYVYLPDGSMLNEELIRQGFGYADPRFNHMLRSKFLQDEKQAQHDKLGLWQSAQPHHWPDWYRKRHDPTYQPP